MPYECIFTFGLLENLNWDRISQRKDWKPVRQCNLNRIEAGEPHVWMTPPTTFYMAPVKLAKIDERDVGDHHYLVYKHVNSNLNTIIRACPDVVLTLASITIYRHEVWVAWNYAISGNPYVTVKLDKGRRYSLVTVETEIRAIKNLVLTKVIFMYGMDILRKNMMLWSPTMVSVMEPFRRLRRRTTVPAHVTLDQYFP